MFSVGNFYNRTDSDSQYLTCWGYHDGSLDLNGTELVLDVDGDTSITSDTDDRIDIKVAGSDVVHVDSGGRVGIGTNSPSGYDDEADNFVIYEAGSGGHAGITIANDGNDARSISCLLMALLVVTYPEHYRMTTLITKCTSEQQVQNA